MKRYKSISLLLVSAVSLAVSITLFTFSSNPIQLELAKACALLTAIGMFASINVAWGLLSSESRTKRISDSRSENYHQKVA